MTINIETVSYSQQVKPTLLKALRDIDTFKAAIEAIEEEIIGHMDTEDELTQSVAYEIKYKLFQLSLKGMELKEAMEPAMNQLALYDNYKLAQKLVGQLTD